MSYQALYRKYRPRNLDEVYGQKVAVNILKNAVQNNKIGHAYLFTGSRGCGKTSVAKILARMVNCENLQNGILCEKCNSCLNSSDSNCVDILEIDAASNNGVNEIRELKSKINLIPSVLKYKVYIIDEFHMLSEGAFNALLKTLEEPPEHVIFILATTELHKVPITIISRCQTIEFKKINNKDMFARLKEISDLEKIKITDDAIWEIVNESDGGLRDAIGLLDMATSYSNNEITEEDIYSINGNVSNTEIEFLVDQIIKKNLNQILKLINDYFDGGKDLIKILEKIINTLKDKMIKDRNSDLCHVIEELLIAYEKMKNSSLNKIYFELAIYKLCDQNIIENVVNEIDEKVEVANVSKKVTEEKVDKKIEEKEIQEEEKQVNDSINLSENKKIRINNTFVEVNKKSLNSIKEIWDKLNDYTFDKNYGASVCELLDANPIAASDKYLMLEYNYDSFVEKGNMYIAKYEEALKNTIGLDLKLVFITKSEWNVVRKKYIDNIKNNVKYKYIDEVEKSVNLTDDTDVDINNELLEKANELFDKDKIEIKEND